MCVTTNSLSISNHLLLITPKYTALVSFGSLVLHFLCKLVEFLFGTLFGIPVALL